MKRQLGKLIRRIARSTWVVYSLLKLAAFYEWLYPGFNSVSNHNFHFPLKVSDTVADLLDEIPSETSPNERRFLYRFFSTIWSGKHNVIEIGPFLGGTTRAIALGMSHNPSIVETAKLYTYDRFSSYYEIERFIDYIHPLIKNDVLSETDLVNLKNRGEFMDIFVKIHNSHDYFQRVVPMNNAVPDRPEELAEGKTHFLKVSQEILVDAVFVDGCKSWFGTKYFMQEICNVAMTGSYFIFQDYGWYTCFWIPAFVELLKDHFQPIGHVDATYAFILTRPLSIDLINKYYPDRPDELGESDLMAVFERCFQQAMIQKDYFAAVRHTIQKAGALAYIGNKSKAKEILSALEKEPWAATQRKIIQIASKSPTYTPEGRITLED